MRMIMIVATLAAFVVGAATAFAGTDVNLNIGINAGKHAPAPPTPAVVVVKPAPLIVKKDNGKHLGHYKEKGKKHKKHED